MQRIDKEKFQQKLQESYGFSRQIANVTVNGYLPAIPEEVIPNVIEWYEDQPLSDLRVEGFSIPMIFAYWNNQDFLLALGCMMELKRNPDEAKRMIWRMKG